MISSSSADDPFAWPEASAQSRPWTRWWWLGSDVDEAGLRAHLDAYAAVGLGGVEIQPVYGVPGREDAARSFLSPSWVEALELTTRLAAERGLGVDLTTGSGWPFGGPWVEESDGAQRVRFTDGGVTGEPVRMAVKRAGPGGEGIVIDYVSETALPTYLQKFHEAFGTRFDGGRPDGVGAHGIRSMFHDSYELEDADWTATMIDDFARLRGYDLVPHLAALAGRGDVDTVARVRSDFRETFSDLLLERFTRRWARWDAAHGWLTRNQAHGSPANLLDLYAAVDIPETEGFGPTGFAVPGLRSEPTYPVAVSGRPDPLVMRFASSAAHLTGKPLVSAESCTWLGEHFSVALAQMKPELDQMLAAGINHVFFHGSTYSAPEEPWPGLTFYAATEINPTHPQWVDLPELTAYLTRVQSVLQSGSHGNDVLLYFGQHDLWHTSADPLIAQQTVHGAQQWVHEHPTGFGRVAAGLVERGWQVDFASDALLTSVSVRDGEPQCPGGCYAAIVVPGVRLMPIETLERLVDWARDGATVIFAGGLPEDVPGFGDLAGRRARLHDLMGGAAPVGAGAVVITDDLEAALVRAGAVREPATDHGLRVVRRRHADGEHRFLVNLGADTVDGWIGLGASARSVVVLDPLTGRSGVAVTRTTNEHTEVRLRLDPGASVMLRSFTTRTVEGAAWEVLTPDHGAMIVIEGPWTVSLGEQPAVVAELGSWTTLGPEAAGFSGTGRYAVQFAVPELTADDWLLDLGDVRESARVTLNGQEVGTAWSLPYRVRVGGTLRTGENVLEIEITNLAANAVAARARAGQRWDTYFMVDITYAPFDPSGWEPRPSGLLGPVRLIPLRR